MVFKVMRNPVYQVVMAMLLVAGCVVWGFDLGGVQTFVMSVGQVGHVGLVGVLVAMPVVVAPFPVDPELTSVSVAYRNTSLIQDEIAPRVPVGVQNFKYRKFALADGFTIPDTKVGRTSAPNKVEFGFTEPTDSTEDYGLSDDIPSNDIINAPAGYDPQSRAVMSLTDLIMLDREKRVSDITFNSANYVATQRETLVGIGQFNDYANSDPISKLLGILDKMLMRGTLLVMGQSVWTILRQHPKVVSSVLGNAGQSGVISTEQLKQKLELKKVLVGSGWYNSAKKGQAPVMARLWGNDIAIHYQDEMATTRDRMTFMLTAQWQNRVAGSVAEPKMGLRGGLTVTVGESVKEVVTANDLGYIIKAAVA